MDLMQYYRKTQDFNPDAGPWPALYSHEEKIVQRKAGKRLLRQFHSAIKAGTSSFEIPPGIYRIDNPFVISDCKQIQVKAPNVEIILEEHSWRAHFRILGSKHVSILGPLTLDASPFGFSQGTILSSGVDSYGVPFVDINLHEGYPFPSKGHRITCFNPETGVLIAHYQEVVVRLESQTNGRVRLFFGDGFFKMYGDATRKAIQTGNLICLEDTKSMLGGFELRNTADFELVDVNIHTFSLVWGLPLDGNVKLTRVRGCRRPGSNRLMGGGFFAFSLFGGSVTIENCELGHNFDDLTDIGSLLGFAFKKIAPNQVYVALPEAALEPGKHLVFYDAYSLEKGGKAVVLESKKTEDQAIIHEFWATLKKASVLTWNNIPYLITLDRPISICKLSLVDCLEARPDSLSVVNSYLHDSLAAGINLKGAKNIRVQGNIVERAGYRGVAVGFDPYWWEGGIPSNIDISDNLIIDTPYNLPDLTPAINIYVDGAAKELAAATGMPMHNIRIANNTIVNAKTAAIGVAFSKIATVEGNIIQNPMKAGFQLAWGRATNYSHPCAILLDTVEAARVSGNSIRLSNPRLVPEVICATSRTDKSQISLSENIVCWEGAPYQRLPDTFFTKVGICQGPVKFSGDWQRVTQQGCFCNTSMWTRTPGASATFDWMGSRARLFGSLASDLGQSNIFLDGQLVGTVHSSRLPEEFEKYIGKKPLFDQLLFDTGSLTAGNHTLKVVVTDASASLLSSGCVLEAVDYL